MSLAIVAAVLIASAVYVERHRTGYRREVRALGALSFAGGVTAAVFAAAG